MQRQRIEVTYIVHETTVVDTFFADSSSVSAFGTTGRTVLFVNGLHGETGLPVKSVMYESAPRIIRYLEE